MTAATRTRYFCTSCRTSAGFTSTGRGCRCGHPRRYYTVGPVHETDAQKAARRAVMYRAGGDTTCSSCGHEYKQHPIDEHFDFLNVLCNGDRVKL